MAKKIQGASSEDHDSLPPLEEEETAAGKDAVMKLDDYGIWVKAEPTDFKEEASFDVGGAGLEDLSLEEEGGGVESGGAGGAGMLDNLDIPEEESLAGLEEFGGEKMEEAPGLEPETAAPEELTLEVEEEPVAMEMEPALESEGEEPVVSLDAGGDFEDISLDDLGIDISAQGAEESAKPKPLEPAGEEPTDHIIDEEFSALPFEMEAAGEGESGGEETAAELDELKLPEEDIISDEMMEEEPLSLPEEALSAEEAAGDLGNIEEVTGLEMMEEIPELELGADESGLEMEKAETAEEIEVPLSEEVAIAESEEELVEPALDDIDKSAAASASILKKIESELRAIKSELTELKSELGMLRGHKSSGEGGGKKTKAAAGAAGEDFFDEEEDETIALTGEELDNILTTADIKEEADAGAAPEKTEEGEPELGEDIISLDEEPALEEAEDMAAVVPESAVETPEELSFDEIPMEGPGKEAETGGEIEIEIPELDGKTEELGDLELESLEEIGPEDEKVESPAPAEDLDFAEEPVLEEAPAEVGDLEFEDFKEETAPPTPVRREPALSPGMKEEIKSVLGYMDQLLESLPEEKIEEFAKSKYFSIYKKLFEELGLVS